MKLKHSKVSAKADNADTSLINPSDWNAEHALSGLIHNHGTIGGARTVNWNDGDSQTMTLNANTVLTFSNPVAGMRYRLLVKQDPTGSRTLTFPAAVKFPSTGQATIASAANDISEVFLTYDGADYFAFIAAGIGTQPTITVASDSSKGLRFGTDVQIWSNAAGTLTQQAYGNGSQSSYHLQVTPGVLPTDTLCELVLGRTADQSFGGNYGRWSFTALGSALNNVSGIYGEFGGSVVPTEFIFNIAYENPAATYASYEVWRAMAGGDLGNLGLGFSGPAPRDVLQLIVPNIGANGTRDSHAILQRGKSNDGSEHAVDWKHFVDVTTNAGESAYKFSQRLDSGSWVDRLIIPSTVVANFGDSVIYTPTWTGFSSAPSDGFARYLQLGKLVYVRVTGFTAGTSNATSMTITLPFPAGLVSQNAVMVMDNSAFLTTSGRADTAVGSNVLTIFKDWSGAGFTASGSKVANFAFVYVIA